MPEISKEKQIELLLAKRDELFEQVFAGKDSTKTVLFNDKDKNVIELKNIDAEIEQLKKPVVQTVHNHVVVDGKTYSLDEWVTFAQYTRKFKLGSQSVIVNWIDRGIIDEKDIIEVPELNTRLINVNSYNNRNYKRNKNV